MPLFEYTCQTCHRDFELLVMGDTTAACPSCQSQDLTKHLSVFSAHTRGASSPMADCPIPGAMGSDRTAAPLTGCGTCGDPRGPGACRLDD